MYLNNYNLKNIYGLLTQKYISSVYKVETINKIVQLSGNFEFYLVAWSYIFKYLISKLRILLNLKIKENIGKNKIIYL